MSSYSADLWLLVLSKTTDGTSTPRTGGHNRLLNKDCDVTAKVCLSTDKIPYDLNCNLQSWVYYMSPCTAGIHIIHVMHTLKEAFQICHHKGYPQKQP